LVHELFRVCIPVHRLSKCVITISKLDLGLNLLTGLTTQELDLGLNLLTGLTTQAHVNICEEPRRGSPPKEKKSPQGDCARRLRSSSRWRTVRDFLTLGEVVLVQGGGAWQ
jgi:hypothetical protein